MALRPACESAGEGYEGPMISAAPNSSPHAPDDAADTSRVTPHRARLDELADLLVAEALVGMNCRGILRVNR